MTKQKNSLGPIHRDSIRRVADVPKATRGHFNTTPGTKEKPIITNDGKGKKK